MEYWIAAGALEAFATSLQVAAHDVANANTEGFRPGEVVLETGPDGRGVVVAEATFGSSADGAEEERRRMEERPAGEGATFPEEFRLLDEKVDLAREMVSMAQDQRAFEANLRTLRVMERMSGYVLERLA